MNARRIVLSALVTGAIALSSQGATADFTDIHLKFVRNGSGIKACVSIAEPCSTVVICRRGNEIADSGPAIDVLLAALGTGGSPPASTNACATK